MLIATFPETREIAKKVANALNAEYTGIITKKFPDGESYVRLNKNPQDKIVIIINSLAKEPNKKIIETILAAGSARDSGAKNVILIATYLPYMRQDKQFEPYESISAKYILKILSDHFDKVFVIDPHLHRIKTLKQIVKNIREITTRKLIADFIKRNFKENFTIVGPDKESQQWGERIASLVNKKAIILKKTRLSPTKVKIVGKKLGESIVIIDDIISTGRTILETIKIAKSYEAKKITVIGIHGIFVGDSDKKIKKHADLVTTNTIPNKYAKIDVSPLFAEALKKFK